MASVEFVRFKKLLQTNGSFVTAPRMRLFGLLQHHPALTLKELVLLIKIHDRTTVYRNIDLFDKLGIINRLRLGWHTKIELSDIFQHHHHHLTCTHCGVVSDLPEDNTIEMLIASFPMPKGFKVMDHQLEIRGLCQACQQ